MAAMTNLEVMTNEFGIPPDYRLILETNYKLQHHIDEISHNFPMILPRARDNEKMTQVLHDYHDKFLPRLAQLTAALEQESGLSRKELADLNARAITDNGAERITRIEKSEWSPS